MGHFTRIFFCNTQSIPAIKCKQTASILLHFSIVPFPYSHHYFKKSEVLKVAVFCLAIHKVFLHQNTTKLP